MTSLKGHLWIATPSLLAPIFAKSVILMLEHTSGALGVVLNRPTDVTVASVSVQVFGKASDWQKTILLGGRARPLVVLHGIDDLSPNARGHPRCLHHVRRRNRRRDRRPEGGADAGRRQLLRDGRPASSRARSSTAPGSRCQRDGIRSGRRSPGRSLALGHQKYHAHELADLLQLRGVPDDPRLN